MKYTIRPISSILMPPHIFPNLPKIISFVHEPDQPASKSSEENICSYQHTLRFSHPSHVHQHSQRTYQQHLQTKDADGGSNVDVLLEIFDSSIFFEDLLLADQMLLPGYHTVGEVFSEGAYVGVKVFLNLGYALVVLSLCHQEVIIEVCVEGDPLLERIMQVWDGVRSL